MPHDPVLQLILDELKATRSQLDGLIKDVSTLKASEATLTLFWAENWGPLKTDIQDIKNRLSHLEHSDVQSLERRLDQVEADTQVVKEADLSKRVAKLEESKHKRQGAIAALSAVGGGSLVELIRYLFSGS